MTIIRTCCPSCGDLEVSPPAVHLQTFDRINRDFYEFTCPCCARHVVTPADSRIISELRRVRVSETHIAVPEEALDPKRNATEVIDYDDLLDFALELGATDNPMDD